MLMGSTLLLVACFFAATFAAPLRGAQGNSSAIQVDGSIVGAQVKFYILFVFNSIFSSNSSILLSF